jgi:rubrerythrin
LLPGLFVLCFVLFHAYFILGLNELKYRKAVLADETDMGGERVVYDPTDKFKNSYQEYKNGSYNSSTQKPAVQVPTSDMSDYRYAANNIKTDKNIVCQYCGNTFASKYKRCPNCNAENSGYSE